MTGENFPWFDLGLVALLLALCVTIAVIDWRRQIIPNACNAAVAGLGLLHAGVGGWRDLGWAAVQGAAAYGLFWLVRRLYRVVRPVQGLGLGDVKFLGAAGIWIGLQGLAPLVLVACVAALICVAVERLGGRTISARHAVPFGPFLALGLVTVIGFSLG